MKEPILSRYRIRIRLRGFEPQMQYTAGLTGKRFWTPLLLTGYWAEPASFSTGQVNTKYPLSFNEARIAIHRAKRINSGALIRACDNIKDRQS
ncbi:hypothetical protein [Burkholderia latens]|uniref:hypothetical protein n=1 Tax=Burkholderia latens TaxID=488446 RepID=UPI001AEA5F68|nr:hypothetical protein [Burkholderia latens]QTO46377.1 hypothetical protein J8I85_18210 [Burkholderia latens]